MWWTKMTKLFIIFSGFILLYSNGLGVDNQQFSNGQDFLPKFVESLNFQPDDRISYLHV